MLYYFVIFNYRLYQQEVEKARKLSIRLGVGIGLFQGLANVALNGNLTNNIF